MSDQEIQELESQFPAASGVAFAAACEHVLASGQSVMQSQGGMLFEVFPDGRRVAVKEVDPPILVTAGTVYTLR